MARRRSILGNLWLQLSLQAAFAVTSITAAQTADAMYEKHTLLCAPADDAFVYTVSAEAAAPPSFEDYSMAFYLPPEEPRSDDFVVLPDLDYALLGGPEYAYDTRADDFLLLN